MKSPELLLMREDATKAEAKSPAALDRPPLPPGLLSHSGWTGATPAPPRAGPGRELEQRRPRGRERGSHGREPRVQFQVFQQPH